MARSLKWQQSADVADVISLRLPPLGRHPQDGTGILVACRLLWTAHTAMTVLETAAFAKPANEAAILAITVPALDAGGAGPPQPFTHWLTDRLVAQLPEAALAEPPQVPEAFGSERFPACQASEGALVAGFMRGAACTSLPGV